jgi:phenylacetate-CoA ligase
MDYLSSFVRHVVAPAWAAWERSPYLRHYQRMLKTQYDPPEVIRERQLKALREMVRHANGTSQFWKKRFTRYNFAPENLVTLADLSKLPLLTKDNLRNNWEQILSSKYCDVSKLRRAQTSGSTGVPVVVYSDEASDQWKRGAVLRSDEWTGWRLGESIASIWGNVIHRKDWQGIIRRFLLDRCYIYLDTLDMTEEKMNVFADGISKAPPTLLTGHAASLYLFSRFLKARRPDVRIRPKGILSTCLVLHDFERQMIEEVFGCKVTNRYGCEEVGLIACECERHEGLHVNLDSLIVEVVDNCGNPCTPGAVGQVVLTDIVNRAMPILRYKVGDMAVWSRQSCSCGRTLPLLEKIEGRVADYVVKRNGEYTAGTTLTECFALMIPNVAQMQIVQEDYDRFVFNIVKTDKFGDESMAKIKDLVSARFGEDAKYQCVFMDKIPSEKSGKFRFCISKVPKEF